MAGAPPTRPLPHTFPLPASYVQRAQDIAAGTVTPAIPRAAATVVLLRDRPGGTEAYLMRRVRTMAFAAGMHVFPGGSVDPRDTQLSSSFWAGPAAEEWAAPLAADVELSRALVCAAVRETFEESGVLLAGPSSEEVVADTRSADWEKDRQALLARDIALADLLERRDLLLRADLLRPWAHWITPEVEERRFDTRFFVAALPEGQRTRDVGGESDEAFWISPGEALHRFAEGTLGLMPPTAFTLAELAAYPTVSEVLRAGTARDHRTVLPSVVVDAGEVRLLLPHGDAGT